MARPKRVYPKDLPLFDKLHTRLVKMYSGVEITSLHLIKETKLFYMGLESWAFCCGKFKGAKSKTKLSFNIPILTDNKVISFLKEHCWSDWVDKELKNNDTDMVEAINFLDKIYPNKKKIFFYELKFLVSAFCHGSFVSYNEDGKIKIPNDNQINKRKYYTRKYMSMSDVYKIPEHIETLYKNYHNIPQKNEKEKSKAYKVYHDVEQDYMYEKHDLTETFINIGKHMIVCPYAFTKRCVEGSEYENAGEIYMIVTPDTIYFEVERHF